MSSDDSRRSGMVWGALTVAVSLQVLSLSGCASKQISIESEPTEEELQFDATPQERRPLVSRTPAATQPEAASEAAVQSGETTESTPSSSGGDSAMGGDARSVADVDEITVGSVTAEKGAPPSDVVPVPEKEPEPMLGVIGVREVDEAILPEGWDTPVTFDDEDPAVELIGAWRQVSGGNDADYAIGGYEASTVYFTGFGRAITVRRGGSISQTVVFEFKVDSADSGVVTFTTPPGMVNRSPIRGPITIPGSDGALRTITPPASARSKLTLRYQLKDGRLELDGKSFVPTEQP